MIFNNFGLQLLIYTGKSFIPYSYLPYFFPLNRTHTSIPQQLYNIIYLLAILIHRSNHTL